MAVQSMENGPAIPRTIADALSIALSPGTEGLLLAAAQLAVRRKGDVGPEELFVAALAIGMPNFAASLVSALTPSSVSSVNVTPDRSQAHMWLYDWLAKQVGQATLDRFLRDQVGSAFAMPTPSFGDEFSPGPRATAPLAGLTRQAQALLWRASFIAYHTMQDNRFGVRHIVASLVLPDHNENNASLERLVSQTFKTNLRSAAENVLDHATRQVPFDLAARWKEIFKNPPAASIEGYDPPGDHGEPTETKPEAPDQADFRAETTEPSRPDDVPPPSPEFPIITLSGFTSDSLAIGNADPLGINPDVRAFARLICLEEATPPLSICLFGEWGSGKSTFMERLQREITGLTRPKRARDPALAPPVSVDEPKFVENIVQIKFNAWHFADASLWASLTAVFFDQLRRGGSDSSRASDYKTLIGKVADKVRSLEAGAANALEKVEDAKRKSDTAHKALDTAEKQLAANDLTLAWSQLQTDFENLRMANQDKLKEVGRRVYRDDLSTDTKAFAAAVAEATTIPGRMALIGRVLVGGGLPTLFGILAIGLIAAAGIGFKAMDMDNVTTFFQLTATWGAGAFAALGALWQAFKAARPIFDGAWKYAKAVEDARAKLTQEAETKRREAMDAAGKLKDAEAALVNARAPLSDYLGGVKADAPSTILRYFLFEDGDVRDYDKQVGIVSRARRSFEQLNSIVTTTRLNRKAAEAKLADNKALSPEEQALLAPADGKGFLVPDRIVLYIDDLDRCTHDQVYAVLQAIHLLLAFELFVVVVGVDVRWIEGAVAKHFEADTAKVDDAEQRRKRAIDYLEKIFQIPFWLERLNTESRAGQTGGSYAAYVQELLKDNERAAPGPNIFKSVPPSGEALKEFSRFAAGEDPAQLESTDAASAADTPAAEEEDEFGAVSAALASLKLDRAEIDFLASPEIGAVASKSPRAVKRLINIYRIVRARLSGQELEEFLGRSGTPPHYPIAALLAAIETGQPVELAEALYPALALLPPDARLNFTWITLERLGPDKTTEAIDALLPIKEAFPTLGTALAAVDRLCGEKGASVGAYIQMARLVRRYSFNRFS
jgi:hypothetical protein